MATILEFDEIPAGSQLGVQTTDRGVISGRAIESPVIPVPPTPPTPSTIGGLVSFVTVARASSNRMLDAPLAMVSTWVDGQPLYSSSFGGATWHWQKDFPAATATDNETTCRPSSWIAGGLPGAAVRELTGNRTSRMPSAWRIDSTAADNEGAGSVGDPLKTDVELGRRWGSGVVALLIGQITVTYAQAPTTETNYAVALAPDASLNLVGTPTITKAGTVITAVQLQARTAGAPLGWAITGVGLGAADVGKLVRITAGARAGAYARVLKDEGGGKVRTSPFGTANVSFSPFTLVTPQVGDVVEIVEPMVLKIGAIRVQSASQLGLGQTPNRNVFTTDSVTLNGGFSGGLYVDGTNAVYLRTILQDICLYGPSTPAFWGQQLAGGGTQGTVAVAGNPVFFYASGCRGLLSVTLGGNLILANDCYMQNTQLSPSQTGYVASSGTAFFDCTTSGTALVGPKQTYVQSGPVADWGGNNTGYGIVAQSGAGYIYTTKPTVNSGLGVGRETKVGSTDRTYAQIPYLEPTNGAAIVTFT